MKFLSLFAGIGGFDLGLERAGHECSGQIEIDRFCRRVLATRWPDGGRSADVRAYESAGGEDVPCADGGSPVERIAHGAARGIDLLCGGFPCQDLSIAGKRRGLAGERSGLFWEIVRIAKATRPTWGLFENVPGLLSSDDGQDLGLVLQGLRECFPVVGFRVLDSQYFGVAQRRRRVFLVGGPTEAGVRAVLFEPEGGTGDYPESRKAGEGTSDGVARSITGTCFKRHDEDMDTLLVGTLDSNDAGKWGSNQWVRQGKMVVGAIRHLGSGGPDDNEAQAQHLVAWNWQSGGDVRHSPGLPNLQANQVPAVGVRRLTPLECERLQGFPDGWTCLCLPLEVYSRDPDKSSLLCKCPDSPRYKALGNAVTVNVIEWLGRRIAA